jgi:hypothetical protein
VFSMGIAMNMHWSALESMKLTFSIPSIRLLDKLIKYGSITSDVSVIIQNFLDQNMSHLGYLTVDILMMEEMKHARYCSVSRHDRFMSHY